MRTLDDIRTSYRMSGMTSLADNELLRLCGIQPSSSVSIAELFRMNDLALAGTPGITAAARETVGAIREIISRINTAAAGQRRQIRSSDDSRAVLRPVLCNLDHEEVWALLLDRANHVISCRRMSSGTVSSCVFDVRSIVMAAVAASASGIIVAHNHPSGNPTPSQADIKQTRCLRDAAALFDISILDHLVITSDKCFSFCDEGL